MKTAVISGWNVGFQKVRFTDLLRRDFGYSLANAKAATDALLDRQQVELPLQETECVRLQSELKAVGAAFVIEDR